MQPRRLSAALASLVVALALVATLALGTPPAAAATTLEVDAGLPPGRTSAG